MSRTNKTWRIGVFGLDLIACFRRSLGRKKPHKVAVIDIGSNSFKAPIFDCRSSPAGVLGEFDEIVGLAEGMMPNDPHPVLNENAIKFLRTKVLRACKAYLQKHRPDAVVVLCSEAIRAAYKSNPAETKKLLNEFMGLLNLPRNAWNILSEEMEARLAAEGVLYGDEISDGFVVTMGGGSTEIAKIKSGRIRKNLLGTFRFGTRTLSHRRDVKSIVNKSFDGTPWFADEKGERAQALDLRGGAFRVMGRILAQRIDHADFRASTGFEGHAFANVKHLTKEFQSLRDVSYGKLLSEFLHFEYRQRKCLKHSAKARRKDYRNWKKKWMRTREYKAWYAKWHKRIGRRVEFLQAAAEVALIAQKRINPRVVKFGAHSVREGALRYAKLG